MEVVARYYYLEIHFYLNIIVTQSTAISRLCSCIRTAVHRLKRDSVQPRNIRGESNDPEIKY